MENSEKAAILRNSIMFGETLDDVVDSLASIAQIVQYDEGESFIHEGADEDDMYIIVEGTAGVQVGDRLIAKLEPNEVVGEMQVLEPGPRSATVLALTPVTLLWIGKIPFDVLASDRPEIFRGFAKVLIKRLREAATKLPPGEII